MRRLERVFRQHDTLGAIEREVASGLGATISTAAIVFAARDANNELVFDDGAATAEDVADAADGTKAATFRFPLSAQATANPGVYHGQFKATHPSGAVEIWPKHESIVYRVVPDYAALDESPEALSTAGFLQTQAAHGFSVGQAVYLGGAGWALAQADDSATLAAGIVIAVPDASTFRVAYLAGQEVTLAAHGLGAAGTVLYLSEATAGLVVTSAPSTGFIQRLGLVKSANTLILWPHAAEPAA